MIRLLFVNFAVLATGLLILEAVFGRWFWAGPLDKILVPRNAHVIYHIDTPTGKRDVLYTTDAFGLRGKHARPADIDVLTIGGSTTNQARITDGETWQDVMTERFAADGRRLIVSSAGVDGHSTVGHIKSFSLWLNHVPGLKPKWILAYIGINDRHIRPEKDRLALHEIDVSLKRRITENSAIYQLYRIVRGMIEAEAYDVAHMRKGTGAPERRQPFAPPPATAKQQQALAAYEARIRALNAEILRFGARPIYVTQPLAHAYRDGDDIITREGMQPADYFWMWRLNARLMRVCAALKAVCIDLESELKFEPSEFYDFVHNTPAGAEKIGAYLYRELKGTI